MKIPNILSGNRIKSIFFKQQSNRWIILGIVIGLISGIASGIFFISLEWMTHFTVTTLAGYPHRVPEGERLFVPEKALSPNRLIFFLMPIVGGLISGFIVYFFAPETAGPGTDAMIYAFHHEKGKIRPRVPFIKAIATILTSSSGGSVGREGPIAQIGAGLGSWLADKLKLSTYQRRIMLLAGAAGGLGSIFRAPLGGAITAIEVLYREDFETDALVPCVIASVTAYAIFSSFFGFQHIFVIPPFRFQNPMELIFYAILAAICVPVGIFYIKLFHDVRTRWFVKIQIPKYLKPMIGGFGIACCGLWMPECYGSSWGQLQLAILGKLSVGFMIQLALFKIFTTSLTIGSGGSGGVFGPTLLIGGMLGGSVGLLANHYFPSIVTQPGAFVLVGMAAFFAGVANAPLGVLLMTCEMTGGYDLLPPLMLVSALALFFSKPFSIYENQKKNKFHSPAHIGEFTVNILAEIKVKEAIQQENVILVRNSINFQKFQELVANTHLSCFPVINQKDELIGIISLENTRSVIFEDSLFDLVLAQDLMTELVTLNPEDSLHDALVKFMESNYTELPVVESKCPNKVIGMLKHEDIIHAYQQEILRRRQISAEKDGS